MPQTHAPLKTPLGTEELRKRTLGLGQRYRTVLLLVDGRRPLGEVLAMAHKAGAQTSHFEELVRMGLIEVPNDVAAPEPVETGPGALDTPRLTSVDVDVYDEPSLTPMAELAPDDEDTEAAQAAAEPAAPARQPRPDTAPEVLAEPVAPPVAPPPRPRRPPPVAPAPAAELPKRVFEDPTPVRSTEVVSPSVHGLPVISVGSLPEEPVAAPAPLAAAAMSHHHEPAVALSDTLRVPDWVGAARPTPFPVADHARPAPRLDEEQRLQAVRDLLVDTLRRDSLLFTGFSVGRVRAAVTQKDLIKLVWEIERDRAHVRRNRDQLLNLQRARELLGMGNTLVSGDSQPGDVSEF